MGAKFQEATSKLLDVMRRAWLKKHGVPLPAPTMTAQQRAEIQECFEMLDRDGSGALDVKEIVHAFGALGFTISKDAISELMSEADPDGSGELEFDEFLSLMGRALYQPDERGVALVAKTGSGDLSFADVVRAFRRKKLIESLIRGGDARLKVVEFHEKVQDLIKAETKELRHRENTHAIFERMESLKAEREKLSKLLAPSPERSSQRSQKVKARMRNVIGRSLDAFESLYRRHQSQSQVASAEGVPEQRDLSSSTPSSSGSSGGDSDGDDGDDSTSGAAAIRCSSPGLARSVTFLTELETHRSGGSLTVLDQHGGRRPRSECSSHRPPARSLSMSGLNKAQSRRVSAAVLKYFKQLEEQAQKMEQKYNDAARMNAARVQPAPDRSEFGQAILQSARSVGHRSAQSSGTHTTTTTTTNGSTTTTNPCAMGSSSNCSSSGNSNSSGNSSSTATTTALVSGVAASAMRGMRTPGGVGNVAGQTQSSASASWTRAAAGANLGCDDVITHAKPGKDGFRLNQVNSMLPPTPPPPLQHPPPPPQQQQQERQLQRQRLPSDGSDHVRASCLEPTAQSGHIRNARPPTAAWTEFVAAAAAMSAGISIASGGGGGGGSAPLPLSAPAQASTTTTMASRAWRQTPSFGPAGSAVGHVGWGAGVGPSSARRAGSGGGGRSGSAGQILQGSRCIGPSALLAADSAAGTVAVQSLSGSAGDTLSTWDGRQEPSPRVRSGRVAYGKRPSSSEPVAFPPLPLSPCAGAATATQDCSPSPRSRSTSPRPQSVVSRTSAACGVPAGAVATTALAVTNFSVSSQAGASIPPEVQTSAGATVAPDHPPSRSNVAATGLSNGGNGGNGPGGLQTPGPMARAWPGHGRSMPAGATGVAGNGGASAAAGALQQRSFRLAARRHASFSSNGIVPQSSMGNATTTATTSGGTTTATIAAAAAATTTTGAAGTSSVRLSGFSLGPCRSAPRNPAAIGSVIGQGAAALVEGSVSGGQAPGLVPSIPNVVSLGQPGCSSSDGKPREPSKYSRLGPKSLTSELDLAGGSSCTSHLRRGSGASGCDDLLSLSGLPALRLARSDCDSEGGGSRAGSRGPTIEGSPGSGDGSGSVGSVSRARRFPSMVGPVATAAVRTVAAPEEAAMAAPGDDGKVDVAAILHEVARLDDAVLAGVIGNEQLGVAATAGAAVEPVAAGAAVSTPPHSAPMAVKTNGRDSIQSSAPSGSPPQSPRYLPTLGPVASSADLVSSSPVNYRNSSVDGCANGMVPSPPSTAAATATAIATATPIIVATSSSPQPHISYGAAGVASSSPSAPPTSAASSMLVMSPMRNRGTGAAGNNATNAAAAIPAAFAPRGAYMSLQLAAQRNNGVGGARSPRRGQTEGSGGGAAAATAGSPTRSAGPLRSSTPAESPPATRTPPLHDRVVVTFFGQQLPRARNGAVMLPAMGLPPQSYPPELHHHFANGMLPMGSAAAARGAFTPSHTRPWQCGSSASTPASAAGTGSPMMAAVAAAANPGWLTSPGGPVGWSAAPPFSPPPGSGTGAVADARRPLMTAPPLSSSSSPIAFIAPATAPH